MHIIRIGWGIRGFQRLAGYATRYIRMVSEEAKRRARVLAFWEKHGLEATKEAFGVSRRTLFGWKALRKKGDGRIEALNKKSTRPKNVRSRDWPEAIKDEIRRLREAHPNLGKEKIHPLLRRFAESRGIPCPGVATIGNLIKDMGGLRRFPQKVRHDGTVVPRKREKKARKPKGFVATYPGHCVSLDTVERVVHGSRRYVITAVDIYSRFAFAMTTKSHASLAAKRFFDLLREVFPHQIKFVLTDNGSEFMKAFAEELKRLHLTHWHTYPRTPKMNAHCERFNRTIQEEYVDYHASELLDVRRFNEGLLDWLLWYNTERVHEAHGNACSPMEFLLAKSSEECKMYLTRTCS